jgi:diguanylate cyclase (GGDEF)-like protein
VTRSAELANGFSDLARWRSAIEAAGDIVYEWDLVADRIVWGGQAASFFAVDPKHLPSGGETYHGRINPEDLPRRLRALTDHLTNGSGFECEYRVRADSGDFQWVHDRGAVERAPNGTPLRLLGTLRCVTQRKQHESRLEYLANFDDLTGHYNKLRLREALDHALANALRFERTGAFVVIGVDALDRINTAYGYEVGDKVLVEVGRRLDRCLRATDVIGRLGGDRFGIILASCPAGEAQAAAERILQAVRQGPVATQVGPVHVAVSAGVVVFPQQSKTAVDVMTKAEGALLAAKTAGRDCVSVYTLSEAQRQDFRASMTIGEEVKQALRDDRLILAYQPVVEAAGHRVQWYECLLRMRDREGQLVPAGKFIPVVEQLGLMRAIDRHVLDLAMADLMAHPHVTLAINISGLTAADRSWLRALVAHLRGRPEVARRLIVEITETAALHDIEDSARFVATVRDLGCQVAIDDFGAGYTTFRHLKALTVDIVKIDGSFIRQIRDCRENQLFVRNLLSLARAFSLATVAECVEDGEAAAYLAEEGLDFLQGWHFGKPELAPAWRLAAGEAASWPADGGPQLRYVEAAG